MMIARRSSLGSDPSHCQRKRSPRYGSQLSVDLDPELLRGVPLSACLSGFGHYFETYAAVQKQVSKPTRKLDAFISHDWQTSRWLKLMCLLIIFNTRAAVVGAFLASIILGLLGGLEYLPDSDVVVIAGYGVFFFLVCFWQRIRDLCRTSPTVFLDKLCINQADPEQKKLGILGLGAFLKASEKLVILWSPRYFRRLWCTYEIVTFLRLHSEMAQVHIIPVKMARLLMLMAVTWQSLLLTSRFMIATSDDEFWFPVSLVALMLQVLVLGPLYNYQGLEIFAELRELPDQLRNFRIERSQCTCCSIGHRNPDTGEEIECDRQLVLSTLHQWRSDGIRSEEPEHRLWAEVQQEDPGVSLEWFNTLVQSQLYLKGNVGGEILLMSDYSVFILGANVPWISAQLAVILRGPAVPLEGVALFIWALKQVLDHAMLYMLAFFFVQMSMVFWKNVAPALVAQPHRALTAALGIPLASLAAWLPWWLLLQQTAPDSLVPLLPFSLLLIADILLLFGFRLTVPFQGGGDDQANVPEDLETAAQSQRVGEAGVEADVVEQANTSDTNSVDSFEFMGVTCTSRQCSHGEDIKWEDAADFFSM